MVVVGVEEEFEVVGDELDVGCFVYVGEEEGNEGEEEGECARWGHCVGVGSEMMGFGMRVRSLARVATRKFDRVIPKQCTLRPKMRILYPRFTGLAGEFDATGGQCLTSRWGSTSIASSILPFLHFSHNAYFAFFGGIC